ncbi:MAG: iron-sulfur cluster repair di-iron protein [Bacteroidia bacterium]
MENLKDKTIGQIVAEDFRTSDVFRSHGIDFCCGGKKSLQKACEEHQVDMNVLENELKIIAEVSVRSHDYDSWELDFLTDYIINTHHKYVEKETMLIYEYAKKVASVHGDRHPEMVEVSELFFDLAQELIAHMRKEEMILFPYIKQLSKSKQENAAFIPPPFGSAENPVNMMMHEHEVAGELLKKINELTRQYTPPADACNTFRVLLGKLNEYENDLHTHIHLENNILFPKTLELEKQMELVG